MVRQCLVQLSTCFFNHDISNFILTLTDAVMREHMCVYKKELKESYKQATTSKKNEYFPFLFNCIFPNCNLVILQGIEQFYSILDTAKKYTNKSSY